MGTSLILNSMFKKVKKLYKNARNRTINARVRFFD